MAPLSSYVHRKRNKSNELRQPVTAVNERSLSNNDVLHYQNVPVPFIPGHQPPVPPMPGAKLFGVDSDELESVSTHRHDGHRFDGGVKGNETTFGSTFQGHGSHSLAALLTYVPDNNKYRSGAGLSMKGDSYPATTSGRPDSDDVHPLPEVTSQRALPPQLTLSNGKDHLEGTTEDTTTPHVQAKAGLFPWQREPLDSYSNSLAKRIPDLTQRILPLPKPPATSPFAQITDFNGTHHHDHATQTDAIAGQDTVGVQNTQEDVSEIDYDVAELHHMDFDCLKQESFDFAPHELPSVLPDKMEQACLAEKLQHVCSIEVEKQQVFFTALPEAEWDEAGDWFNEQFASLTGKLSVCRQERRQLARSFEAEIAQHHDAVVDEQDALDEALREMKRSGGMVVKHGTPKKK